MYTWNWGIIPLYKTIFLQGALITLGMTFLAVVLGTVLGGVLATFKRSTNIVLATSAKLYIELFRALPILVVLIWIYYVLPILTGWAISSFNAGVLALSLHLAAFVAETARAGIESIPQGQFEAGFALGLSRWQVMGRIILPQALKNMLPNLIGLYITELKNSSLTSIIAVNELLHRANTLISNTFRPLEIYTTVAIVYLALILPMIFLARRFEKQINRTSNNSPTINYEAGY